MKIGMRTPSPKKRISARTTGKINRSIKRSTTPFYGTKGTGWVKDPKRAMYNKIYNETTVDATNGSNIIGIIIVIIVLVVLYFSIGSIFTSPEVKFINNINPNGTLKDIKQTDNIEAITDIFDDLKKNGNSYSNKDVSKLLKYIEKVFQENGGAVDTISQEISIINELYEETSEDGVKISENEQGTLRKNIEGLSNKFGQNYFSKK